MEIVEDLEFKSYLIRRIAEREFSVRTGVHSSDLTYCLNKQALRRLQPVESTEHEVLLFSVGWSTQRWLTGKDEDEPEVERDGIIVTLDAIYNSIPWELKATYQSSERPIEDNIHWVRQLMSQCYVSGTTEACLSRLELMGNWKSVFGKKDEKNNLENKKPSLHAFRVSFTPEELERHWEWMKQRRDLFNQVLATGQLLPKPQALASGMEFECAYCSYQDKCC